VNVLRNINEIPEEPETFDSNEPYIAYGDCYDRTRNSNISSNLSM